MKFKYLAMGVVVATMMASCGESSEKENKEDVNKADKSEEKKDVKATYNVDTESSKIIWEGQVVSGVYGHKGTLKISEGTIKTKGDAITGGSVVADMKAITPTDDSYNPEEGKTKEKLVDHLSTDDFFAVEEYPTAEFKIKKVEGDKVIGDLTIRGNTHEETAQISKKEIVDGKMNATADLTFDRQKYDVKFKMTGQDMVLSDDIELTIEIVANAK